MFIRHFCWIGKSLLPLVTYLWRLVFLQHNSCFQKKKKEEKNDPSVISVTTHYLWLCMTVGKKYSSYCFCLLLCLAEAIHTNVAITNSSDAQLSTNIKKREIKIICKFMCNSKIQWSLIICCNNHKVYRIPPNCTIFFVFNGFR